MKKKMLALFPCVLFAAAVCLIIAGVSDGGFYDVLEKARMICFECIGLG